MLVAVLLGYVAPITSAATIEFQWNVNANAPNTVPERYLHPVNATVGDTLLFYWTDPSTAPSTPMFHEVVQMADETCTFHAGYSSIPTNSRFNAYGIKTATTATVALTTVRYFLPFCQ